MLKKLKIIDKKEDINLSFDLYSLLEVIENIKLIPIGANELFEYCSNLPILIYGKENEMEFVIYSGIDSKNTMFSYINFMKIPELIKAYPFFEVKTKNNEKIVAIDDTVNIGVNKKYKIFENEVLSKIAQNKVNIVQNLSIQRDLSKMIIKELQNYDLLKRHNFKVNNNGKTIIVLDNYYIIDEKKLELLSNEVLASFAKKGWMGIINAHLHSINNFNKLIQLIQTK